jgi:hypothetical protein
LTAPADCPIHPVDRYGLELAEQSVPQPVPQDDSQASAEQESYLLGLGSLRWSELTALWVIQISYLAGLAVFARWAVRHWMGA